MVVIGILGTWISVRFLPTKLAASIETHWPKLPLFAVEKEPVDGGKGEEIYFTVPTRQLTPQEIARLEATKPATKTVPVSPTKSKETSQR